MEVANIAIAFATCVATFLGMNLVTGLEDHPWAFFLASPGVNFTNILRADFFYKSFFCTYILSLRLYGARISAQKPCVKCW
jgi:hypothetical protein